MLLLERALATYQTPAWGAGRRLLSTAVVAEVSQQLNV